jgi:hypothetical protein
MQFAWTLPFGPTKVGLLRNKPLLADAGLVDIDSTIDEFVLVRCVRVVVIHR